MDDFQTSVVWFVTGGTTGQPRLVKSAAPRMRRSIRRKAEAMRYHGVDKSARVAVCHPFEPWSIGPVHLEAARVCGANVFPVGLNVNDEPFQNLLADFLPTHVCASGRNLIRLGEDLIRRKRAHVLRSTTKVFLAGSPLQDSERGMINEMWGSEVVDVYGLAQFDMVGCELDQAGALSLVPHLQFSLNDPGRPLVPSHSGELIVRDRAESERWHPTGDLVDVIGTSTWPDAKRSATHLVRVRGRVDLTVAFGDGSAISEMQVRELLTRFPSIMDVQLQIRRHPSGDVLHVLYVRHHGDEVGAVDEALVRSAFLHINIDVADAVRHNVIRDCTVREVQPGDFQLTQRGKAPIIWDTNRHAD